MALTFYDIPGGETRDLTQGDLEEMLVVRASHGRILTFLADERTRVMTEISNVRARHASIDKDVSNG